MDSTSRSGQRGSDTVLSSLLLLDGIPAESILANVMTLSEVRMLYPSLSTATFYRRCVGLVTRKSSTGGPILTTVSEALRVFGQPEELPK